MLVERAHGLTNYEVLRYSRQILVENFGPEGQQKLKEASLLVIGAGALGSLVIMYCAGAGVGRVGIADDARVTKQRLNREVIHTEASIGEFKVVSAEHSVKNLNSSIIVQAYCQKISEENAFEIICNYDYVVDCTNSASSRSFITSICHRLQKPLISGTVNSRGGEIFVLANAEETPCECCSFSEKHQDQTDDIDQEMFGPAYGIIGCIMATEVIKTISSVGDRRRKFWRAHSCKEGKRIWTSMRVSFDATVNEGHRSLANFSLLIVGAGGLGSPVALYCAAAGVGRIGVADHDNVSIDNLHRQIAHREKFAGEAKIASLKDAVLRLNPNVTVEIYDVLLNNSNARSIIDQYDIVADCSDNVPTRYLLSDACCVQGNKKPVASGSALGWDGQFTIYNYEKMQKCFRCLHPTPIPVDCAGNCSDSGVIGPVVGLIGSLQALEILRMASGLTPAYAQKLFVFDGHSGFSRDVMVRGDRKSCFCYDNCFKGDSLPDYELFCNARADDKAPSVNLIPYAERITAAEALEALKGPLSAQPYLLDTRPSHQFRIGHLQRSVNVPYDELVRASGSEILEKFGATEGSLIERKVLVICRRGNHSQLAVLELRKKFNHFSLAVFKDIVGGYTAWQRDVDSLFPVY